METVSGVAAGASWRILIPSNRRERMRGLRGRPPLGPREALLLVGCRSVHTFGLRYPIVVARLDRGYVVRDMRVVRPRRVVLPSRGVRHTLECAIGTELRVGDRFKRPATR
jgi:hypothetical protein